MPIDRGRPADDEPLPPEDVDSAPTLQSSVQPSENAGDPADDVPVPIAMSPAEIDERAQVVEKLREDAADSVEPPALDA
jgi:hypothetical protein